MQNTVTSQRCGAHHETSDEVAHLVVRHTLLSLSLNWPRYDLKVRLDRVGRVHVLAGGSARGGTDAGVGGERGDPLAAVV